MSLNNTIIIKTVFLIIFLTINSLAANSVSAKAIRNKLLVENPSEMPLDIDVNKNNLGINETILRNKIEIELQRSGITPLESVNSQNNKALSIEAVFNGYFYMINIFLYRFVEYSVYEENILDFVITYNLYNGGYFNKNKVDSYQFYINSFDEMFNTFLNSYLKANRENLR